MKKRKKKPSPMIIFSLTLAVVLLVGFSALFILSSRKESDDLRMTDAALEASSAADAQGPLQLLWQTIPEEKEDETAAAEEGKYTAELADAAYMEENRIHVIENETEGQISFCFAGDILFDDEYAVMANLLQRGGGIENAISPSLIAEMQNADVCVINNEFPYTNRGTPTEGKTYTFRADTNTASYLTTLGADVVSLANNHTYDFGEQGLLDSLNTLEEIGVEAIGAGRNLSEAASPVYYISGDLKVGIIAATQIERLDNPDTKGATDSAAGVFRCWNPEKLYETVREAKENCDFVIVFIHWGTENVSEPDWAQLEQAEGLEEAGADLIIGAHPHCLQGISHIDDTPVFYSLGNFWFNSKTLDTGMVKAVVSTEGLLSLQFIPAVQSGCITSLAEGEEAQRIYTYLNSLSDGVSIASDGSVGR